MLRVYRASIEKTVKASQLPTARNPQQSLPMGFTLIELIVVVALLSITLFLSIPRFQNLLLQDDFDDIARWIMVKVPVLKDRAFREQKRIALNIDIEDNRLWVTDANMSEEEKEQQLQNGYQLPSDFRILDVEFPNADRVSVGQTVIYFHPQMYSDMAVIHIEDDDSRQFSFIIESLIHKVTLHERYVGFADLQ